VIALTRAARPGRLFASSNLSISSVFAQSRTFVSAQSGNDSNTCTATSPCRSFSRAVTVVARVARSLRWIAADMDPSPSRSGDDLRAERYSRRDLGSFVRPCRTTSPPTVWWCSEVWPFRGRRASALDTGSFNQLVLHVENTTITGFDYGIRFVRLGILSVKDSFVREATAGDISAGGTSSSKQAEIMIDNVRADATERP
jgi:hypothetical protein